MHDADRTLNATDILICTLHSVIVYYTWFTILCVLKKKKTGITPSDRSTLYSNIVLTIIEFNVPYFDDSFFFCNSLKRLQQQ